MTDDAADASQPTDLDESAALIVGGTVFVCSPAAARLTGQVISVNGDISAA
jgi:hypothetical protein